MTETKAMTLRLPQEQADELATVADIDGKPVVEVVREAIATYISARRQDPQFRQGLQRRIEADERMLSVEAVADWKGAYFLKLRDFARETLRTSRMLAACNSAPPQVVVGEALLGYQDAQRDIRRAAEEEFPDMVTSAGSGGTAPEENAT